MRRYSVPVFVVLLLVGSGAAIAWGLSKPQQVSFVRDMLPEGIVSEEEKPTSRHVETPDSVKAVYMSQCVVGTPSFRDSIVKLIDDTELNSVVIDIKDYTGKIAFTTDNPKLADSVSEDCGATDMKSFIETLHDKNIYVIGRITVFQDPYYTKKHPEYAVKKNSDKTANWKDRKGLSFIDVGAKPYWEYVVELSKESYAIGFDEINYDYIRFPSDGDMTDIYFSHSVGKTKRVALEEFFKYLRDAVKPEGIVMSADIFGMTTTNHDDLNIGQILERALPYFDYIAPMVYPSHYPSGFNGYKDVNAHAYDIVNYSMEVAAQRAVATTTDEGSFAYTRIGTSSPAIYSKPSYSKLKLRPWLQDFDYPVEYTPAMVQAQIQATLDAGLNSYMFWDPGNKYSSLKQILAPAQ